MRPISELEKAFLGPVPGLKCFLASYSASLLLGLERPGLEEIFFVSPWGAKPLSLPLDASGPICQGPAIGGYPIGGNSPR
jgi:hypothetical protein